MCALGEGLFLVQRVLLFPRSIYLLPPSTVGECAPALKNLITGQGGISTKVEGDLSWLGVKEIEEK